MYHYKAKLVRVIDGDTIDVDIDLGFDVWLKNQRVRLAGIDSPECRTRNKLEKTLGLAAKARLTELCSEEMQLVMKAMLLSIRVAKKLRSGRKCADK